MKKLFFLLATVACGVFCSCSEDEEAVVPAVGITKVTVTPAGAVVSNNCLVKGLTIENTKVSVALGVAPEALQNALVSVTATIGTTVYYNDVAVEDGKFTADVTSPITIEARGANGVVVTYTLKVVQATTMSNLDMEKMASTLNGFPEGVIDYDVAYFKGKFYAAVASLSGTTENYDIFASEDGVNWAQVNYTVNTNGVSLPDGQDSYVVGGEGATLAVFNDRLYVLGGARTKGADKFGNEAETNWGMASITNWRSFSTADGLTFDCDTVGMSLTMVQDGEEVPVAANRISTMLARQNLTAEVFNGKMYMISGYSPMFGMMQPVRNSYVTTDGKNWTALNATADDGKLPYAIFEAARFVLNGKMWVVAGHFNYIDAGQMNNAIYASEDGETWLKEGEVPAEMQNVLGLKAVVVNGTAYVFGGQKVPAAEGEVPGFASIQVFRSANGINWETVAAPETFVPLRSAKVVGTEDQAWIFGGISSLVSGNYAGPAATDVRLFDTWVKNMK